MVRQRSNLHMSRPVGWMHICLCGLSPWDIAGGIVIAQEVGAVATNMKGEFRTFLDKIHL